jgi:hypothetical protein
LAENFAMNRRELIGHGVQYGAAGLALSALGWPAPGWAGSGDLPTPKRLLQVSGYQGLKAALQTVRPGDQIVLGDGTYGGPELNIASRGTGAAPVVICAKHPLRAVLACDVTLSGEHVVLDGVHICGGGLRLSGSANRITRSKLSENAGCAITCVHGCDGIVDHCDITTKAFTPGVATGERRNPILVSARPGNEFYRCRIVRNWIHDIGPKPTASYYSGFNHPMQIGETSGWSGAVLATVVAHNLVENSLCGSGQIEAKSSGNIIRANTLLNCPKGRVINRQGQNNVYEANWLENTGGMDLWSRATVRGNRLVGGGHISVGAGTIEWNAIDSRQADEEVLYQRSYCTRCIGNCGALKVGFTYPPFHLPARDTRVEGHDGSIGYGMHIGTTVAARASEPVPVAVKLGRGDVGPFAA